MSLTSLDKVPIEHVHPINDRLIVQRDRAPDKTDAGIHLPQQAREVPVTGIVVAGHATRVRKGDRVLFHPYGGAAIAIGGEEFILMKEEEVLAIISEIPPELMSPGFIDTSFKPLPGEEKFLAGGVG
jgi:chaperonin GroES